MVWDGGYKTQSSKPSAKEAGTSLARLMERQLGYVEGHIDSVALRLFIRAYWSRVACYAHTIHDADE
jgi:hypothetical protein